MKIFATVILCLSTLLIISCGGGGGGGGKSNPPPAPTKVDQTPLVFSSTALSASLGQEINYSLQGGSGTGVISYSSSNVNVATIDISGKISILGVGNTIITAKKSGDQTYKETSAAFSLTVSKKPQENFQFPQLTLEIRLGETPSPLTATGGNTANPTSYKIENTAIATIDPITGNITLLKSGETRVIATKAGDDLYDSAETQYRLIIKKQLQSPLAFQELQIEKNIDVGNFKNNITGGSGTGAISYTSSNPLVANVDEAQGTINLLSYGETIISVTKKADEQFEEATASFTLTVVKKQQRPLAFEKPAIEVYLGDTIYSNPLTGGSGSGLLTYSSSDENIAVIDKFTGQITPIAEGKVVINASKAGDADYLADTEEYSLQVSLIVDGLIADAGLDETLISWRKQSGAISYFRTTNTPCDINNINSCSNGKELYIAATTVLPVKDNLLNASSPGFVAVGNNTHISSFQKIEKKSPAFTYRSNAEFIAFKNQLFVIGGVQNTDIPACNNEIWISKDGLTWNQAKKHAAFSARNKHQIIEFNNALWLYGGEECIGTQGASQYSNELWRSEDGINWAQVYIDTPMSSRADHSFIAFNGKMWLSGGAYGNSEIWSSSDGSTWEKVVADAPFKSRRGQQMVAFNNKLWLIGGLTFGPENFTIKNDIWSSMDGINWAKETESANFSPRQQHQVVAFNNALYLIGGNSNDFGSKNESWRSVNGVDWSLINSPIINGALSSSQVTTFNNQIWLLENNSAHSLWRSTDGIKWYVPQKILLQWMPRQ